MYGAFDSEEGAERIGSGRYQTGAERSENARIEELTPEILNNFIDRIYIGEKYSDGSAHKQEIRIIYKFIGAESTHGYKVKGSRVAEIF